MSFSEQIAVRTLWGECRGEPEDGQRAVAHVLWNRLHDGRWGKSLATVCLARLQFSCWNASDPQRDRMAALSDDDPVLAKMRRIVTDASSAVDDPTGGALYYYSDSMKTPPDWAAKMRFLCQIGHHRFYTDKP